MDDFDRADLKQLRKDEAEWDEKVFHLEAEIEKLQAEIERMKEMEVALFAALTDKIDNWAPHHLAALDPRGGGDT